MARWSRLGGTVTVQRPAMSMGGVGVQGPQNVLKESMPKDRERDLGLVSTTATGIGAMVGSGIFILPDEM
ncbi:hypothetical protein [Haladaptatus sp. R4]|uniref:hypothetical protein n=1 Tax=Haladaptatus sp. R4 TaxID=1679489 RepID=UPI000AF5A7A8|nr:hypothetical protein [Haladaptatus sp. R4]